jgi:hypothetical protein
MKNEEKQVDVELVTKCLNCPRCREAKIDSNGLVEIRCENYPGEECENIIKRRHGK